MLWPGLKHDLYVKMKYEEHKKGHTPEKLSSSQQLDFIRSEQELKSCALYGFQEVLCACSEPVKNCMGELGWPKCVGNLGWLNWVGMLCWLGLACHTVCASLFKVRPVVLSKTLSHICGKLNLPIFLFNVELVTLINTYALIFLAKLDTRS